MEWKIDLPIRIPITKNVNFSLNLNAYRNAHYQTLNKAKVTFKQIVSPFLVSIPQFETCEFIYTLYPKTNRLCDVANICSVVDKFFSDAFVENGHLKDDNYTYLPKVTYLFGSIDKLNPRVEVLIKGTPCTVS